ncbi:MAG: PEP-utilizing enzyme [Steroidobacteraceae bacterium]
MDRSDLHQVQAGEVLVCEGTSPSWTPAFTKIAACVCDQGGTLARIDHQPRIPGAVRGGHRGRDPRRIVDGDLLDVDGSAGTVTAR